LSMSTFTPVHQRQLSSAEMSTIIRSKTFAAEKYAPSGKLTKLKMCTVTGEHQQDKSVYSEREITSPTVNTSSVIMVAGIAARESCITATSDVGKAYLNASIGEKRVFVVLEPKIVEAIIEINPPPIAVL
jgi:hypothetical protein